MLHILLIFDFFPCLHALLGTARLSILLKNSYLHFYLELKMNCFRQNLSISLDIWLQLDPLTCLIHFCIQLLEYLTFKWHINVQNHSISGNFLTCMFIKFWKNFLPTLQIYYWPWVHFFVAFFFHCSSGVIITIFYYLQWMPVIEW